MKLFWSPRSPFVRKVMVCAHEVGVADRIEKVYALVSMTKVNPDVLRVNPVGRIPAMLTDDGTALYDSNVICEYLDAQFGGSRLFRANDERRWETLRRLSLADGMLETGVLWRSERTRPAEQQSSPTLVAFERKMKSALDALEDETLVADAERIDIGDIAIAVALSYLDFRFAELAWRDHHADTAAWFAWFNDRASMKGTVPYEES